MFKLFYLADLSTFLTEDLLRNLWLKAIGLGEKIIFAAIIYIIGAWLASLIRRFVKRVLSRRKIDETVSSFIYSLISTILTIALIVIVIGILGFPTTSLAALLAAAGLAVGMAMKDNLSNFAGGVMILMNKPFRVGDRILGQSEDGIVKEIGILYTVLLTADARTVYLPNGPLSTGNIINYSKNRTRRIDIQFNLNYGNDIDELKTLIRSIIDSHGLILKDPIPFVGVTAINNSNFDLTIRVWVLNSDYGTVSVDLNESVYKVLSGKEIFTSPTLNVKMVE